MHPRFAFQALIFAVCLFLTQIAAAAFLSVGPPTGAIDFSDADLFIDETSAVFGGEGWVIGAPENPIPISYDPSAGPWIKALTGLQNVGPVTPGSIFTIIEHIRVGSGPDWFDWHEEIDPSAAAAGWSWAQAGPVGQSTQITFAGTSTQIPGLNISGLGTATIWFDFAALTAGTVVQITKYLAYNGSGPFSGSVLIAEYPTVPLPAAVWLFGSGLAGIWLTRRRRLFSQSRG